MRKKGKALIILKSYTNNSRKIQNTLQIIQLLQNSKVKVRYEMCASAREIGAIFFSWITEHDSIFIKKKPKK